MNTTALRPLGRSLTVVAAATLFAACADSAPLAPRQFGPPKVQLASLGTTFQSEDEFGVYALHAWVWRDNPNGLFAETNPRVSCGGA